MGITVSRVDRTKFFGIVDNMAFNVLDEREAFELGYKNVRDCLRRRKGWEARYFILRYNREPMAVVMLERDGHFSYFVSKRLGSEHMISLIRALRKLTDTTVRKAGGIMVDVAPWRKDAIRVLKLVGFRIDYRSDSFDTYVKESNGLKD